MTDSEESSERVPAAFFARAYRAIDAERRDVARDLRDGVGQLLSALAIRLDMLKSRTGPELRDDMDGARALALRIHDELVRISAGVHPSVLDQVGLEAAVHQLLQRAPLDGVRVEVHIDGLDAGPRLPPEVELALFRIIQQALANVRRHARATTVVIFVRRRGGLVRLLVEDNGVGCDPALVTEGLGLRTIRERARVLNGHVGLESLEETGTTLCVLLPCDGEAGEEA